MVGQHWTSEDCLLTILPMWYYDVGCNVTKTIPPFLSQSNSIESLLEASLVQFSMTWTPAVFEEFCLWWLMTEAYTRLHITVQIKYLQNSAVTTSWRPPNLEFRANILRIWASAWLPDLLIQRHFGSDKPKTSDLLGWHNCFRGVIYYLCYILQSHIPRFFFLFAIMAKIREYFDQAFPPKSKFRIEDIPDLSNKVIVVTGMSGH